MHRTAFSIALAAEMFVVSGVHAQAPSQQPPQTPPAQPVERQPDFKRDGKSVREQMEKEWKQLKKDWDDLSDDQRVLSVIRAKNKEEIEAGKLAAARGTAQSVREFGSLMVREHGEADAKLSSLIASENIVLWDTTRTNRAMLLKKVFDKDKDKGKDKDKDRGKDGDRTNDADRKEKDRGAGDRPAKDHGRHDDHDDDPAKWSDSVRQMHENPLAWLNAQPADQFDRIYGHMMHKGHAELLRFLDKNRDELKNERVKAYVSEVAATVRRHHDSAEKLPGAGDGIKRDDTKIYPPGNKPDAPVPDKVR